MTQVLLNLHQVGDTKLATKWEVLFANTFTQTDSESFSSSVMGICEISLWISNITPSPSKILSFLYTLYGQDSGNSSGVDMELSILSLELPQSEVDESQGKPTTQVPYPLCY